MQKTSGKQHPQVLPEGHFGNETQQGCNVLSTVPGTGKAFHHQQPLLGPGPPQQLGEAESRIISLPLSPRGICCRDCPHLRAPLPFFIPPAQAPSSQVGLQVSHLLSSPLQLPSNPALFWPSPQTPPSTRHPFQLLGPPRNEDVSVPHPPSISFKQEWAQQSTEQLL